MTAVRLTEQQRSDRRLSGIDLQRQIRDLSAMYGWLHMHVRPAQTVRGWRTPVTGQLGPGWPDLVLVQPVRQRTLAVEVKREFEELSADQVYVHSMLRLAGWQVEVWRPHHMSDGTIQAELGR